MLVSESPLLRESMLTEHVHYQCRCQGFFCCWGCRLHHFCVTVPQVFNPSYLHIVALGEGQLRELCALGPDLLHPRICHLIKLEKRSKVRMHMIVVTTRIILHPRRPLSLTHTHTHTPPCSFFPFPSLDTWSHRARVRRSM